MAYPFAAVAEQQVNEIQVRLPALNRQSDENKQQHPANHGNQHGNPCIPFGLAGQKK
ncbi:hypothetical protein D3C86_2193940 [compost metagenome]